MAAAAGAAAAAGVAAGAADVLWALAAWGLALAVARRRLQTRNRPQKEVGACGLLCQCQLCSCTGVDRTEALVCGSAAGRRPMKTHRRQI